MAIYEVTCPFCQKKQAIDSRKHMYRRLEHYDNAVYVLCQTVDCGHLFRVDELKEIDDLKEYMHGR